MYGGYDLSDAGACDVDELWVLLRGGSCQLATKDTRSVKLGATL